MNHPPSPHAEKIHTMPGWYDGPRSGIADYLGRPHAFESLWDTEEGGCWANLFLLMPIDEETFALAIEDWDIWQRWKAAFHAGKATLETHPALPEDRQRHEIIKELIGGRLEVVADRSITARGDFKVIKPHSGPPYIDADEVVLWTPVEESIDGTITYSALNASLE